MIESSITGTKFVVEIIWTAEINIINAKQKIIQHFLMSNHHVIMDLMNKILIYAEKWPEKDWIIKNLKVSWYLKVLATYILLNNICEQFSNLRYNLILLVNKTNCIVFKIKHFLKWGKLGRLLKKWFIQLAI